MWRTYLQQALRWIGHVIRQPREELDRWQRAARFSYDLVRYGAAQLREDRAPQMAAALAYQALFALVPVLVVAMLIVQAVTNVKDFMPQVDDLLSSAGLAQVTMTRVGVEGNPPAVISLQDWLRSLIEQAASVKLAVVGWVGGLVIVYAAISMLVTIENSFNTIYRAPEGRSWGRRIPLYWFLITVSPLAVIATALLHGRVEEWARSLAWGEWFVSSIGVGWSMTIGWLFWFSVYSFVPNTNVDVRRSALGAFVCVILLEIGKKTLGAYLSNAFTVSQLYGSLGLIPLFMFWVYLMWLAVLFGLEVSATLQFLGDRALEEMETRRAFSGLIEPAVVVSVMEVVAEDFHAGVATTQRKITDRTGVPERVVAAIVQELAAAGLVHRLDRDQTSVCLSKPPEDITADRVMDVGFRLADGAGGERSLSRFVLRLREHQRAIAKSVTLATLLPVKAWEAGVRG